jgi:hypothetical protein
MALIDCWTPAAAHAAAKALDVYWVDSTGRRNTLPEGWSDGVWAEEQLESSSDLDLYIDLLIARIGSAVELPHAFTVDQDWASATLSMPSETTRFLAEHGLPTTRASDRLLFDPLDLTSLSYAYGKGTPYRSWMVLYTRQLRNIGAGPRCYMLRCSVPCPDPGHSDDCSWGGVLAPDAAIHPGRFSWSAELPVGGLLPDAPSVLADIFDRYADVSFHILPEELRTATGFVRSRRLAECSAMARTIVEDGRRVGIDARMGFGIVVTPPFSSTHSWAEFRIGDEWVGYDPLLIRTVQAIKIPGADELSPYAACSGLFHRLATDPLPPVSHRGEPCKVVLATRQVPAGGGRG